MRAGSELSEGLGTPMDFEGRNPLVTWFQERRDENGVPAYRP
jgi:hypothetical protein